MSSHVCEAFKFVDQILPDGFDFEKDHKTSNKYNYYCRTNKKPWKRECNTIGEVVNAVTIMLLHKLSVLNKNIEYENKNNEYITYVMLWLSNKMKLIKKGSYGSVGDFHVTFIRNSKKYQLYHDKINKNRKLMNLEIHRMRKLYGLLNELCNAITKHTTDPSNCSNFSKFVNDWIKLYIQLVLKKKKFFEDEYYCNVLVTLKNAYEKFKKDNDTKKNFPEIIEIAGIKTCEELGKEAKSSSKVIGVAFNEVKTQKDLEKGKDTSRNIDLKSAFEFYSLFFSKMFTNIGNSLYENVFPTLEDFYGKLKNFAGNTINHVNKELKKAIETYAPNNCISEEKDQGSNPPSSQESLSEKGDSDQKGCEASQITLSRSATEHEIPVSNVARDGTTEMGDNPFNVYKNMGFSILIILIPIALAIMYKYLPFGWRKKSKKKKKMKKAINMFDTNETTEEVINPTDRKKQMKITINLSSQNKQDKKLTNSSTPKKQDKQFINSSTPKKQDKQFINSSTPKKQDKQFINSNDRKKKVEIIINSSKKKQTKDFINSTYWGKYPLLNIYKLMKADPVPFIILFLLFIFYLYKRKGDSLE
ncbi:PIR protein [Plasmodium yoelii]|uniref:PIR protein n=3 Tax=Plasmodium yoelii TaxID=5861 RepID=A0AAE9WS61_PLAYO|nr:PIR protein [Plasmodium yoelii]EAA18240.1 putative yir4 protein [Plasmodium yoelii yoelii]WBY57680.1 PIR protein [Plasmodium yoelii yoelii]VTZ78697.1 PIR protein [Plasmodium yoelii]|eukprot:XP_034493491.1 PIR protein [Plasmodium yoelii]